LAIKYLDQGASDYRAGVCNIGPKEIARRRRSGLLGLSIALGLAVLLVAVDAPMWARGLVLLPLWGGLVSLEQVRRRFCVGFAMAGIRSANPGEVRERVEEAGDLAADRAAAAWMVAYCGAIAAVMTFVYASLPI
jgi:Zn-dependent protease